MVDPKRILVVSTYPIKNPQHGGQKRTTAFVDEYKRAGYDTKHIAIYMDNFYADANTNDISIKWSKYQDQPEAGYISDVILSNIFETEFSARKQFIKFVEQFKPDIIQIEQAFLYRTVKHVLNEIGWKGITVHSSQNIEMRLKRQILEANSSLNQEAVDDVINQIHHLEELAIADADWNIACTEADARDLKQMGAKEVLVATNGINREAIDLREVERLKRYFAAQGVGRIILYVGSAHPPNLTGYKEMIGGRVGFLDTDTRLVVVGGVADMIYGYAQELPNYLKTLYFNHVTLLGRVEEKTLAALLHIAHQVILPIVEGEGSNLKTAEAILADKFVVATTKAFRSYEKYFNLPNVTIADTDKEFCRAMSTQLKSTRQKRTADEKKLAEEVLWKDTLKIVVDKVKSL